MLACVIALKMRMERNWIELIKISRLLICMVTGKWSRDWKKNWKDWQLEIKRTSQFLLLKVTVI